MSDETNAERQRRFKERKLAEGLVLLKLWLKPERADEIRKAVSANEPVSTNGTVRVNGGVRANGDVSANAGLVEKVEKLKAENAQIYRRFQEVAARASKLEAERRFVRNAKGAVSEREWALLVKVCREDTGPHATDDERHRASQLLTDRRALLVVAAKVKKAKS